VCLVIGLRADHLKVSLHLKVWLLKGLPAAEPNAHGGTMPPQEERFWLFQAKFLLVEMDLLCCCTGYFPRFISLPSGYLNPVRWPVGLAGSQNFAASVIMENFVAWCPRGAGSEPSERERREKALAYFGPARGKGIPIRQKPIFFGWAKGRWV
jgi:hypothetical protein